MAVKDMERVSHLEAAYEHMATKAELAEMNGDYKVKFVKIDHRFESIEDTMSAMLSLQQQILERLDGIENRLDNLENSNAQIIGFQTSGRAPEERD